MSTPYEYKDKNEEEQRLAQDHANADRFVDLTYTHNNTIPNNNNSDYHHRGTTNTNNPANTTETLINVPEDNHHSSQHPRLNDRGVSPNDVMLSMQPYNTFRPCNPAPFGLMGFAFNAFVFGLYNCSVGITWRAPNVLLASSSMCFAGFGQLIAGLLEFRNGNTFGGTAFSSYGMFWISFALIFIPGFGTPASYTYSGGDNDYHALLGIYMIGWMIFSFSMWSFTLKSHIACSAMFLGMSLIYFCLGVGNLVERNSIQTAAGGQPNNWIMAGGGISVITSAVGWYWAMAELCKDTPSFFKLPFGDLSKRW